MKNKDCLILVGWDGDKSLGLLNVPGVRDVVSQYLIEAFYNDVLSKLYLDFLAVEIISLVEEDNLDSPTPIDLDSLNLDPYLEGLLVFIKQSIQTRVQASQRLIHIHFSRNYIIFELMGIKDDHFRTKRPAVWRYVKRSCQKTA